jgi:hypothetical protein
MRGRTTTSGRRSPCLHRHRSRAIVACVALIPAAVRCSSPSPGQGDSCNPDQNGVYGTPTIVLLEVSDTAFRVGTADGGPLEPNVTTENATQVTLTLTNVGTRPHDLVVQCQATPNTGGCPTRSCFPPDASIPSLNPGKSATTRFITPVHEGNYLFTSDLPGDTTLAPDGGVTGLVGQFVLM